MPVLFATAYFPPGVYLKEALQADEIAIEAFETYTKQTYRNHCTIFGPNGRQTLSIPVIKANGNHTRTKDVLISEHQPWQKIHWRSIETAYNNSPFFLYYQDHFIHFYERKYTFLLDLNLEILHVLLKILRSNSPVTLTKNFQKSYLNARDLRSLSTPMQPGVQINYPHYTQVFESRHSFIPGLSILDIIFNLGPETSFYLQTLPDSQFSLPLH
jgi:hypothetical protein